MVEVPTAVAVVNLGEGGPGTVGSDSEVAFGFRCSGPLGWSLGSGSTG